MNPRRDQWYDDAAGPVVRPYAMTRGRTRPASGTLDLITMVVRNRAVHGNTAGLDPEHLKILEVTDRPMSIADITAALNLPLGVVRVLLGDLLERRLLHWRESPPSPERHDEAIYRELLNGLRAL